MAQEGRAYALNEKAGHLLQALRAPRQSRIRKRLPFLLEDFRQEAMSLEQRTRDFALGMPVEFFAEYRARRRALAAHYEWLNRRATDYLRPQLDELDALLAKRQRGLGASSSRVRRQVR